MANGRSQRDKVFISFSHVDKKWLDRLSTCLAPSVRDGRLAVWTDGNIQAGSLWKVEIQKALDSAKVAVLLVSPSFLASEFISRVEVPALLASAQKKGLTVLWVLVSHSRYKMTPIADYQAVIHPSKKSLDKMSTAQWKEALNMVAEAIENAFHAQPTIRIDKKRVRANKGAAPSRRQRAETIQTPAISVLSDPDADHCVTQLIDRVGGANAAQTQQMRVMLRKVMIDGLQPEDAWELLGLDVPTGQRLWFMADKQFSTHFDRFVNRLEKFRDALKAVP